MDFLDPKKRQAHNVRLIIGYVLISLAIGLATIILVYAAYGYGISTKTGDVIQNGLLFADSKPHGAKISLNGKDIGSTTAARLVLPAGNYTLSLSRDGYRKWEQSFTLNEHSVGRYVYPFLFPITPQVTALKNYSSMPPLTTQSPSRHWLLVQIPSSDPAAISFDQYDTTALTKAPVVLDMPAGLLSAPSLPSQLTVIEWSSDNNHVLFRHTYSGGSEFILFNRDSPASSLNLNTLFKTTPDLVSLVNQKTSQLYFYSVAAQAIQLADIAKATVGAPLLEHVLAFKAFGPNLIAYITDAGTKSGQVQARFWDSSKTYPLDSFASGSQYLLDVSQFQGHTYFTAGSSGDARINIYQDPLSDIVTPSIGRALPLLSLNLLGADKVAFSDNGRFVEAEKGQNFAVYDLDGQSEYRYNISLPLASDLVWMDGYRLIGETSGNFFVSDYDGQNQQTLTPTALTGGGLFSQDFNHLFSLNQKADGSVDLSNTDMRAGTDLPKTP